MDYILSWDKFDEVQKFITHELTRRGAQVGKWEPEQQAAWDTSQFVHNNTTYNMSISCRKNDMIGLSITRLPDMHQIVNESIAYHANYKEALQVYLKEFE
jgi:hypothetical protein